MENPRGQMRQHHSKQEASPIPFMAKIITGKKKRKKKNKEKKEKKPLPEVRDQPAQELWLQVLEGETRANNKQAATFWTRSSSQVDCNT